MPRCQFLTALSARTCALLLLSGTAALVACSGEDDLLLRAHGTVEIRETDVSALVPARVAAVLVAEGDTVARGDTLVLLTQTTLASDIELRQARLAAAEAALRDLEVGARDPEIARAESELRLAQTEVDLTSRNLDRMTALLQGDAISQAQHDAARAAADAALARREALSEALKLLREGSRAGRIQAARAEVAAARAALTGSLALREDLVLTSPVKGLVLTRNVEPGEVVGPGTPTVTIGNDADPWLRVFVATAHVPRIHIGDKVYVILDGLPEHVLEGLVLSIDTEAQFSPRIALTEDERADLMFGVKVALPIAGGFAKAGLPATVHFDTSGTAFATSELATRTMHPLVRDSVR